VEEGTTSAAFFLSLERVLLVLLLGPWKEFRFISIWQLHFFGARADDDDDRQKIKKENLPPPRFFTPAGVNF
jgi:hypothetical protein